MPAIPRLVAAAQAPIDAAGLAAFRVMFGVLVAVDLAWYWAAGWIDAHYVEPAFLLRFPGFWWLPRLPAVGMYLLVAGLMVAAVAVALGLRYRLAAWTLAIGKAYLFLLVAAHYLNHGYLLVLVAVLMACVPAADALSLDARRRPARARGWTRAWVSWLLRAQLAVVYLYGAVAKLDADWLAGEPVRTWLHERAWTSPLWMTGLLRSELTVGAVAYGGLAFDLLVVPALLWRRTRVLAVLASLGFHLTNAWLFHIGIFPWFMLAATTLFLASDWPRRVPWIAARLGPVPDRAPACPRPRLAPALCALWLAVQLLVPLRHHLYPGPVSWTEEGHYFSWRMKLRAKHGAARFFVRAPETGESWVVDPAEELTPSQAGRMAIKPDLVLLYAHHLADRWRDEHGLEVEVRARVYASLNRRPWQPLVDPEVDLARISVSLWPASWIMPAPQ